MGEKKLKQANRNNNNAEVSQPIYQNGFCAPNPMLKNRNQMVYSGVNHSSEYRDLSYENGIGYNTQAQYRLQEANGRPESSLRHLKHMAEFPEKYKPTREYKNVVADQKVCCFLHRKLIFSFCRNVVKTGSN